MIRSNDESVSIRTLGDATYVQEEVRGLLWGIKVAMKARQDINWAEGHFCHDTSWRGGGLVL